MCDYSLMGVPNRLARDGEDLVVHEFGTGSRGLAPNHLTTTANLESGSASIRALIRKLWVTLSTETEEVAVCIPPGARLLLCDIPQSVRSTFGVEAVEEVVFTQITAEAYAYRDAVRFRNGRELLLQQLNEGQKVRVLQLSLEREPLPPVAQENEPFDLRLTRLDFIAPRLIR